MKKILSFISVMAMLFALVSCTKGENQEAAATAGAAADNSATAAANPSAASDAAKPAAAKPADATAPPKAAAPKTFTIPNGTAITVFLNDPITTAKAQAGDTFTARVADPIAVNGETVVERGATVNGKVIDAAGSGRVKGKANIRLALTSIVAGGKSYPIVTEPYAAEAESTKKRDAGLIAGAGGVGAAIGAIAGGGSGAAKGAVIGGAAGTGAVLATKGKEVELDSETKLTFPLEKATELPKIR